MTQQRYVVSATIDGQEVARTAVWANDAREVAKMDVFSDDQFTRLSETFGDVPVNITIKADNTPKHSNST